MQESFRSFLETKHIREADWTIAKLPRFRGSPRRDYWSVDRKMVINALNSGSTSFMADFEDSNSPTWENAIEGQINLRDAVKGTISYKMKTERISFK